MNKIRNENIVYLIRITKRMVITLLLILIFVSTFVKRGKGTNGGDLPKKVNAHHRIKMAPGSEYGKLPLTFLPNKGQVDRRVKFYTRTPGYTLWLIKEGLVFDSVYPHRPLRGHLRHKSREGNTHDHVHGSEYSQCIV